MLQLRFDKKAHTEADTVFSERNFFSTPSPLLSKDSEMEGQWDAKQKQLRFLDRDGEFNQSNGSIKIQRKNGPKLGFYLSDIVHTLLHKKISYLLGLTFFSMLVIVIFFSPFFWLMNGKRNDNLLISSEHVQLNILISQQNNADWR